MHLSLPRPLAAGLALALAVGALLGPVPALATGQVPDAAARLTAQTPPPPPPPPPTPPGGNPGQNPNPSQPATPPAPPSQPPSQPPQASASGSSAITLTLEEPTENDVATGKSLRVKGWAVDTSAPEGTGISEVNVYIDGTRESGSRLGTASYGQPRRDVADALGQGNRFLFSGFELIWTEVLQAAPGIHTITVAAYSPTNGWAERTVPVTIVGQLSLTAQAFVADPFPYGGVAPVYGAGAVPIYTRPITGTSGTLPPLPGPGYGIPYPNPGYVPSFVPVTFTAVVTRNGAPVPGAVVLIGAVTRMPPSDLNGYTQATVTLPLTGPGALVGSHLSVTYEGQTADADAYVRWYY